MILMTTTIADLRYPIGKFERPAGVTPEQRRLCIRQIEEAPSHLRTGVSGLSDAQLDTPYRSGGWTVRQVVHHLSDSHMNAYVRMKLALTESQPTIKPYEESLWAELHDGRTPPVDISLTLLEALHKRWVLLLTAMTPDDFRRTLNHPESGIMSLDTLVALYAWHGRHHVAHITSLRSRMGW
jgi:uncharacterized damage-inducible protein DinB